MTDGLILVCRELVYILENIILFYNFYIILEYKGKYRGLGMVLQIFALYLFERPLQYICLMLTQNVVLSIASNFAFLFSLNFFLYRGKIKERVWAILLYVGPAYMAELTTYPLLKWIALRRGDIRDVSYIALNFSDEYNQLGVILCGQILIIYWGFMLLLWKVFVTKSWVKEYFMFLIIPIYQGCLFFVYYSGCAEINNERIAAGFTLLLFGVFVNAMIIYLINGILKKIIAEKELKQIQLERQKELEYYQSVNVHMEQVRGVRHEFANQLQVIYRLLEEKDEQKTRKMLDAAYENLETAFRETYEEHRDGD